MKKILLLFFLSALLAGCSNERHDKRATGKSEKEVKKEAAKKQPVLHVYNMGGVPEARMQRLVASLREVCVITDTTFLERRQLLMAARDSMALVR